LALFKPSCSCLKKPNQIRLRVAHPFQINPSLFVTAFPSVSESTLIGPTSRNSEFLCGSPSVWINTFWNPESYSPPFSVATLIVKYGEQPDLGANPALFAICNNLIFCDLIEKSLIIQVDMIGLYGFLKKVTFFGNA
jgi:hypothetical protein